MTEKIHPDTAYSNLQGSCLEWSHKDFVFRLTQEKYEEDQLQRLNQYFNDYNQKRKLYPFKAIVDFKFNSDYALMTNTRESNLLNLASSAPPRTHRL